MDIGVRLKKLLDTKPKENIKLKKKRRKKNFVPSHQKDYKYWIRRIKNTHAARKNRLFYRLYKSHY